MEHLHGLKYITLNVKKHVAPLAICFPLLVCDKMLGVPAFMRLVYLNWSHGPETLNSGHDHQFFSLCDLQI